MSNNPKVDIFLKEIQEVCAKHGLSISHEDEHGSFVIVRRARIYVNWLNAARIEIAPEEVK